MDMNSQGHSFEDEVEEVAASSEVESESDGDDRDLGDVEEILEIAIDVNNKRGYKVRLSNDPDNPTWVREKDIKSQQLLDEFHANFHENYKKRERCEGGGMNEENGDGDSDSGVGMNLTQIKFESDEEEDQNSCGLCDKSFGTRKGLNIHMTAKHTPKSTPQQKKKKKVCLAPKVVAASHIDTIDMGGEKYKCTLCGQVFNHFYDIYSHTQEAHQIMKPSSTTFTMTLAGATGEIHTPRNLGTLLDSARAKRSQEAADDPVPSPGSPFDGSLSSSSTVVCGDVEEVQVPCSGSGVVAPAAALDLTREENETNTYQPQSPLPSSSQQSRQSTRNKKTSLPSTDDEPVGVPSHKKLKRQAEEEKGKVDCDFMSTPIKTEPVEPVVNCPSSSTEIDPTLHLLESLPILYKTQIEKIKEEQETIKCKTLRKELNETKRLLESQKELRNQDIEEKNRLQKLLENERAEKAALQADSTKKIDDLTAALAECRLELDKSREDQGKFSKMMEFFQGLK